MIRTISRSNIVFVLNSSSGYVVFTESNRDTMILIKITPNENKLLGEINFSRSDLISYSFIGKKNLLVILLKNGEIYVYDYSESLERVNEKPLLTRGIIIKSNDTDTYISSSNVHNICNLWKIEGRELKRIKIKEIYLDESLFEFNHIGYAYKNIGKGQFKIFTPSDSFIITSDTKDERLNQNLLDIALSKSTINHNFAKQSEIKKEKKDITTFDKKNNEYSIVSENQDKTIKGCAKDRERIIDIYKLVDNEYILSETLDKHSGIVKCLYFSPDCNTLFSGSSIGEIKVWKDEGDKFKIIDSISCHNCSINNILTFNSNNCMVSLDSMKSLTFWGLRTHTVKQGKKKQKRKRTTYVDFKTVLDFPLPIDKITTESGKAYYSDLDNFMYDFDTMQLGNISAIINKFKKHIKKIEDVERPSECKVFEMQPKEINDDFKNTQKTPKKIELSTLDLKIRKEISDFRNSIDNLIGSKTTKKLSPIRRKTDDILRINVGIDFGTSYTKVAYGRTNPEVVKPLLFDHNADGFENYYIPSIITFNEKSELLLGIEAAKYLNNYEEGIYNFKMLFISEVDGCNRNNERLNKMVEKFSHQFNKFGKLECKFRVLVIAFLAYVMHESRLKLKNEFVNRPLDLSFNICIPVDYVNDNLILKDFQQIIAASEFLERIHPDKIRDIEFINNVYKNISYDPDTTRVYEVPETVAEVAAYTNSRRVKSGLHVILDFGAGTTDISIINIKWPRSSNQKFVFYASNIINHGFRKVDRLKKLGNYDEVELYLQEIWDRTQEAWHEAYYEHLKDDKSWRGDNVQIFISGGGSQEPLVKEIFCQPRVYKDKWSEFKHPIEILPIPLDYEDQHIKLPFHRFAVAYGLTTPKPQLHIEDFVLPKDAKDDTPKQKMKEDVYQPMEDRTPFK